MREHCIDLFFEYRGLRIHVLTDGNYIPDWLNDRDLNRSIQQELARIEYLEGGYVDVNPSCLELLHHSVSEERS